MKSFDTVYPYSSDLERAVLGAMMLERKAIEKAIQLIDETAFYQPCHRIIFKTIIDLYKAGIRVDQLAVTIDLEKKGELGETVDEMTIATISGEITSTANIQHHCNHLIDFTRKRGLIHLSKTIIKNVQETACNSDALLASVHEKLYCLSDLGKGAPYLTVTEAVTDAHLELVRRSELKGKQDGVLTGFQRLDRYLGGIKPGRVIILAAKTGKGKTAFALDVALRAATDNMPTVFYSLEMPIQDLALRIIAKECSYPVGTVQYDMPTRQGWEQIADGCNRLSGLPLYFYETPGLSLIDFEAKTRQLIREHRVGFVVIDYVQLMRGTSGESRRLEVESISRKLKELSVRLHIPILALSQFSRKADEWDERRPKLSDLRESGSLEQDADTVLFIHDATAEQKTNYKIDVNVKQRENIRELIIAKNRSGRLGTVLLYWLGEITKFENLEY